MGKKDDKSSLYSCGGKGAVGLELKASGLQGECSTRGLAASLNWKKGNQKQDVGKKYEENFELFNSRRNVNLNAHISDRMWIITIQCRLHFNSTVYIHFILFR